MRRQVELGFNSNKSLALNDAFRCIMELPVRFLPSQKGLSVLEPYRLLTSNRP